MDDLLFSARRASTAAATRPADASDADARFRTLVQSPLRAGILRYLNAHPDQAFDVDQLMQAFGRLRLDIEHCVREHVDFGVARVLNANPPQYIAERPGPVDLADLLDHF